MINSVVKVVNIIRSRPLAYRQFKTLLEDIDVQYRDVLYHNSVRWLSHSKVLRRVYELREEILIFLEIKKINCDFRENMTSDDWRCDFMFAIEVFEKLNNLNLELQGKGIFAHNMPTKVKAFEAKLLLFSKQTFQNNFSHFALLNKINVTSKLAGKYSKQSFDLKQEFERRFSDFKIMKRVFSTVASPFSADVETAPDSLQLELIDLQADNELQMMFKHSDSLVDFYKLLPAENYIHLRNFAARILCVFGSTYICKQAFSCLNQNKSKNRSVLSNANV